MLPITYTKNVSDRIKDEFRYKMKEENVIKMGSFDF